MKNFMHDMAVSVLIKRKVELEHDAAGMMLLWPLSVHLLKLCRM